ncbi:MAG TPA: 4-hydroxy-tetrahydrodipicolinate reductase [Acidimicrobiales bacterium]|jgi:4-hydroxy-tetrahydrodipicolinate reductase|nr:4-hydroxy-tetrahydrodipicolinate reductase [Acidimicrobiales bacterium]
MKSLVIVGGAGRMGQALGEGLSALEQFSLVALVDEHEPSQLFGAAYALSLDGLDPSKVDVVIDFSSPQGVVTSATWCAEHGVALVIGTTGLSKEQRRAVEESATRTGVVMASNFSIGAVLSERFAAMAAPYFERAEIIELHHDRKVDAPSGTSISTATMIANARRGSGLAPLRDPTTRHTLDGARGADAIDGVKVHSVRLPGLVAHQEILFGSAGEGLTIRHDSFDRQSFVHGVALAAIAIDASPKFLDGISTLIP